jgi:hypothetical protein
MQAYGVDKQALRITVDLNKYVVTYTGCGGSVTNNSTWVRIGYRIYSLWRL